MLNLPRTDTTPIYLADGPRDMHVTGALLEMLPQHLEYGDTIILTGGSAVVRRVIGTTYLHLDDIHVVIPVMAPGGHTSSWELHRDRPILVMRDAITTEVRRLFAVQP